MDLLTQRLFMAAAGGNRYLANAVEFDGANDYLLRGGGLTGVADSANGLISFWFKRGGIGTDQLLLHEPNVRVFVTFNGADNKLRVNFQNSADTASLEFSSTAGITDTNWHHLVVAVQTNFTNGNKIKHIYLDRSSLAGTWSDSGGSFSIDFTTTNWAIGANTSGSFKYQGSLAEFFFAPGQFLDLSVSSNLDKFNVGGKPVSLGATGSLPTGTAPRVYLNNAASTFGTNKGTGGNFTITGSLTDVTPP